jgi:hypothetical protein
MCPQLVAAKEVTTETLSQRVNLLGVGVSAIDMEDAVEVI